MSRATELVCVCCRTILLLVLAVILVVQFASSPQLSSKTLHHGSVPTGTASISGVQRQGPQARAERNSEMAMSFEPNLGQVDPRVKFLSRGPGYQLYLTAQEAVLSLADVHRKSKTGSATKVTRSVKPKSITESHNGDSTVLRTRFVGANPNTNIKAIEEIPTRTNYFLGNDPSSWRTNVPNYLKVRYDDVYPGIDLLYYGNGSQLEYDFIVSAGADPGLIRLDIQGADGLRMGAHGNLVLHTPLGEVQQHKPVVYQELAGSRKEVACIYRMLSETEVGFEVGKYDPKHPLIIDPTLDYSTYLGGSLEDDGVAVAVDGNGSTYITGITQSVDFPASSSIQAGNAGSSDVFVAKVNSAGNALVYATYLGGAGVDQGTGIAIDSSGNAYISGLTFSSNFPTSNPIQNSFGGGSDAFLAKLNPLGSALLYSTFLGGTGTDEGRSVAVDSSGNATVAGFTFSSNFPVANSLQNSNAGGSDAFVSKLSAVGTAFVYSTYLGGSGDDQALGVATDVSGNAYATGKTSSVNFPTANAFQGLNAGGEDAFITKLNSNGTGLLYSTYLGGTFDDAGRGIAVDASGNALVTGQASSANFPLLNALQGTIGGSFDAFVSKVDSSATALVYSTFLGGSDVDLGFSIAVDSSGSAYVTGRTFSSNFPLASPLQATFGGGAVDAYVAKIYPTGSGLLFSSFLGGSGYDVGVGLAADNTGNVLVTGITDSTDFPLAGPLQATYAGGFDAFVSKISTPPTFQAQVQQPINADGSSVFKMKRGVVPLKFALTSNGTSTCDLPTATLAVFRISGTSPGPINESEYVTAADNGSNFRISGCQYIYNLGTGSLGPGSYLAQIKINGIVVGNATFGLN